MTATSSNGEPQTVGGLAPDPEAVLLEVDNLHVEFKLEHGIVKAVNGLSYKVDSGETVAILGESGSGKSVSAQAVMGIVDSPPGFITQGSVKFRGIDLIQLSEKQMRHVRGDNISIVFQDALTALNPVFTVGWQIGEMFRQHRGASKKAAADGAVALMDRVKIPAARSRLGAYPHEFSGGMRQRIMIAMSLALDPDVLIADEPTTALDVTVQAQVMDLLKELQQETGMGLILITHDLGVVAEVADRLVMMYAGRAVEKGTIDNVYENPGHPYTIGLMNSIPRPDEKAGERLTPIRGAPPDLLNIPSGCAFRPRCDWVTEICAVETPDLEPTGDEGRLIACHRRIEVFDGSD